MVVARVGEDSGRAGEAELIARAFEASAAGSIGRDERV
jgi:hypothetical protein